MRDILKPLTFEDLPTRPPLTGRPQISDDIQQTAALLVGWDKITRRLVYVNPAGVLHTASPPIDTILNITSTGDGYTATPADIPTSEVLLRANPDNSGRIWVRPDLSAGVDYGYPLDAGEWVNFAINNLHRLAIYFTLNADKVIIIYTK